MKRMTPLPGHEQRAEPSLVEACEKGFWQCKTCKHIGEPVVHVDPQDVAAPLRTCAKCGGHHLKWTDPVFT